MKKVEERAPNNMSDKETGALADRHISVASDCQAIYRIVPKDETEQISRTLESSIFHVPTFPSLESIDPAERVYDNKDQIDADLVELLLCLDWKMNLLIKTLAPQRDETIYPHRATIKEMSVANLKIETSNPLDIGTALEFHFVLPILPFKELFLRGEVIRGGANSDKEYEVLLNPNLFKDSDREHLIRYVVRRQFQIKRENIRSL
jgi:hypothetical protein